MLAELISLAYLARYPSLILGSIFTSSARGSCNLLAIEIAPLNETFISGYSSVASLDAEYTEAPASLTIA